MTEQAKQDFEELFKNRDGLIESQATVVDRLGETARNLHNLEFQVDKLAVAVNSLLDKQGQPKIVTRVGKTSSANTLDRIALSKVTVYLHYSREEDKRVIRTLSKFLRDKGYVVPGIEGVMSFPERNIRYFHDGDHDAAQLLQRHIQEFLQSNSAREKFKFGLINLGLSYPNVPKGVLEVWLYF